MKRERVKNFLLSLARPFIFSLAMSAFIWIAVTYDRGVFSHALLVTLAAAYSVLAMLAVVNFFKGDRFLVGSSVDVLSLRAQKIIRWIGWALPIPAALFSLAFFSTVLLYDGSSSSIARCDQLAKLEYALFGKSVIWSYVHHQPAIEVCSLPVTATPEPIKPATEDTPREVQADVDFGPYMADLQRKIKRQWYPPKSLEPKRVTVLFKVYADGRLSDLRLEHSSGSSVSDHAALRAVEKSAPFSPLPAGSPEKVDIQFTFDYNVFSGSSD
ncbi:MAG TPA: energy transducer TonB [Candidatus Obscuribacterales bacterium]